MAKKYQVIEIDKFKEKVICERQTKNAAMTAKRNRDNANYIHGRDRQVIIRTINDNE